MFGITLRVWGDYACFTRPEMKSERVTYDVMTPSSARGILEAIHWKPAIKWVIDEIYVCKPIQFSNIKRNERKSKISEISEIKKAMSGKEVNTIQSKGLQEDIMQRTTIMLTNVEYVIKAHFELTDSAGEEDTKEKHINIFLRRARNGQCYNQPYLGCREFSANFELVSNKKVVDQVTKQSEQISLEEANAINSRLSIGDEITIENFLKYFKISETKDFGYMLYDIDFKNNMKPMFFRAKMEDGVIKVPDESEVIS